MKLTGASFIPSPTMATMQRAFNLRFAKMDPHFERVLFAPTCCSHWIFCAWNKIRQSHSDIKLMLATFSCGRTPAITFVVGMPTVLATARAVTALSPEIIQVLIP